MLKKLLFALGVLLLVINLVGLFKSMRNPELYTLENEIKNRKNDVIIKYPDIKDSLKRKSDESKVDYAVRINGVIHNGFAHYWKTPGIDRFYLRVPIWENYMLYVASFINPKKYERYEFTSYKKGLERGAGVCSGHSIVLKGFLKEQGIKAELLDVGGRHVVVRAEIDDTTTYLLDPDFGVNVPYDTAALTKNPELARAPYAQMANLYYSEAKEPYTTELMVDIFGKRKYVYNVYNWFEGFSYIAIWVLPVLLLIPYFLQLQKKKNNEKA
ncbi:hypothetical protein [Flavihumibacter sp. UBA7668]|uniref:hypothetical protein n=1 Tax=Flavihumibacter sp. UBA7668 TaxID=1946542 RepID=UPI0025C65AE7|nr:hypothetical protein [Flavihumibacter sp. UBA7668]